MPVPQIKRRPPFRRAGGPRHASAPDQAGAVLHQRMAQVTEPAFATVALAVQPGVRIGRAFMALVGALLAAKVPPSQCALTVRKGHWPGF